MTPTTPSRSACFYGTDIQPFDLSSEQAPSKPRPRPVQPKDGESRDIRLALFASDDPHPKDPGPGGRTVRSTLFASVDPQPKDPGPGGRTVRSALFASVDPQPKDPGPGGRTVYRLINSGRGFSSSRPSQPSPPPPTKPPHPKSPDQKRRKGPQPKDPGTE